MTEPYKGIDRRYAGEDVDVTYSLKRCIHAEHCVNRLSAVFDKQKRPWINSNAAAVDQIASVVELCPSGALHYTRRDGLQEAIADKNVITVRHNGPLQLRGNLAIQGATVALQRETRATLCRCGASSNKPFCDNAHKNIPFEAVEVDPVDHDIEMPVGGNLTITVCENGPLDLQGEVKILNEADQILFTGDETRLCRCGESSKKPFCDGTHQHIAFVAE